MQFALSKQGLFVKFRFATFLPCNCAHIKTAKVRATAILCEDKYIQQYCYIVKVNIRQIYQLCKYSSFNKTTNICNWALSPQFKEYWNANRIKWIKSLMKQGTHCVIVLISKIRAYNETTHDKDDELSVGNED